MQPPTDRIHLSLPTLLFAAVTLATTVTAQQQSYDDFNGTTIRDLWYHVGNPSLTQSRGSLRVKGPPFAHRTKLLSSDVFKGNFDFILDYQNLSSTATISPNGIPRFGLRVSDSIPVPRAWIAIERRSLNNFHWHDAKGEVNGIPLIGASKPSVAASGQLRLTRQWNLLIASFKEFGQKNWQPLWITANFIHDYVQVEIYAYSGDNGSFSVSSDKISYAGLRLTSAKPYGSSCNGILAGAANLPAIGNSSFGFWIEGGKPFSLVFLIVGLQKASLDLTPYGARSCFLNVSFDFFLPTSFTNANGRKGIYLPLPNATQLIGFKANTQLATFSPSANNLGWIFSNGIAWQMQK